MLNPSYILPSRKTASQSLLDQVYTRLVEAVKGEIATATAVTVTTDGWTSVSGDCYLGLTVHFINDECELRSFLLECFQYNERHTAENLAAETKRILAEWSIYNKVVALVTDNAANMSATARLGGWKHLPCFAHSLNLIVQAGLKEVQETHIKVKAIVEFFKRSPQAAAKLRAVETQLGCQQLNVKQDMPVRWNSTKDMFERILQIKEPLISTLALVNYEKNTLTLSDWQIIAYSLKALKVFQEVTVDVSAEKNVTISKIIYLSRALLRHCRVMQEDPELPVEVQNMVRKMQEQLIRRFSNIEDNLIIAEPTLLDPRFKKYGFADPAAFEKTKAAITKAASHIVLNVQSDNDETSSGNNDHNDGSDNDAQKDEFSIWADYDNKTSSVFLNDNATAAGIVEVNRYIQEPIIKRSQNPLMWWKERKFTYPRLFELMKTRLCIPATSVPCERVFSKAGLTISDKRSRLSAQKVQKLLFINGNHKLLV
jgi:hypothetical protein